MRPLNRPRLILARLEKVTTSHLGFQQRSSALQPVATRYHRQIATRYRSFDSPSAFLLYLDLDLLHSAMDPQLRQRRRPALSCVLCRQRKVKCDRTLPCKQCATSGNRNCTYAPTKKPIPKTSPHPSSTATSTSSANDKPPGMFVFNASPDDAIQMQPTQNKADSALQDLAARVKELENQLKEVGIDRGESYSQHTPRSDGDSFTTGHIPSTRSSVYSDKKAGMLSSHVQLESKPSKVQFLGHSHWMNALDQVGTRQILNSESC